MRTAIDLPDDTYQQLKVKAATERRSIRENVMSGIERELNSAAPTRPRRPFRVPVISSSQPGTLHLTNEQIDDILASS